MRRTDVEIYNNIIGVLNVDEYKITNSSHIHNPEVYLQTITELTNVLCKKDVIEKQSVNERKRLIDVFIYIKNKKNAILFGIELFILDYIIKEASDEILLELQLKGYVD